MPKAFLLAAGRGERLRPITDSVPKCLLPFDSKPLLQIWLELLRQHGVDQVLINTHWHHGSVEQFLKNHDAGELHILSVYEPTLLGSAGTLLANREWINDKEPFFILYGDNLTNVNLSNMYLFHQEHDLPFTLGTFRTQSPKLCGIAEVGDDGVVQRFEEKPQNPKSNLAAAGVYVADCRIFDFFPKKIDMPKPLDIGFHIIPNLIGKMHSYNINDFLMDVGTHESYQSAKKAYNNFSIINENVE